jgi:hypothetical protein
MKKILLFCIFSFTVFTELISQCSNYQVYESFGTISIPTQGGTWAHNSAITVTSPVKTGVRAMGFNGAGDWIRTPQISSPGILSFWYRRSGNATAWSCIIETSPDAVTWTSRGTITTITTTYQQYSLNLGTLGLSNVYIRIRDTRSSGAHERYIDDLSWTSTTSTNNSLIPFLGNCSQTVNLPLILTDPGSYSETYRNNLSQTITFTPANPGDKLSLDISLLAIESTYDYLYIYDGPSDLDPVLATLTGNASSLSYISTGSTGSLTIKFTTDVSNVGYWEGFQATISQITPLPVELLYFKGTSISRHNVLTWATASENNSSHFDILTSTDGLSWKSIGIVSAAQNSTSTLAYSIVDNLPNLAINYYKLTQYDLDGKSKEYSLISIDNRAQLKKVVRIVNLLGQTATPEETGILLEIYEDSTVKKIYR